MTRRHSLRLMFVPIAGVALTAALWAAVSATPAAAHTVLRGLSGPFTVADTVDQQDEILAELGQQLGARVVRVDVAWPDAEPTEGVYDEAGYLAGVAHVVDTARANGMECIVMVWGVPRWASDKSYWGRLTGYPGYQPFYPMSANGRAGFERFATHLATLLKGKVLAYECWNEPNLWPYIYPQQIGGEGLFAAKTYVEYLKRFSPGIRAGDPDALVLAGATAPLGENDPLRTSPQRFAQAIRNAGVSDLFDGYSHHPYCVGGRKNVDPALPPAFPDYAVETGNIDVLLKVFPTKPFYLTEFGYNSAYSAHFGTTVSAILQARYLKKSYALMSRHEQVKALMWYQLRDTSPTGFYSDPFGVYMGLRTLGGRPKRAWYAYAGGNGISINAPESAPRGTRLRLHGAYTCAAIGGVSDKPLLLQRRWGTGSWTTLRTVTTGADGRYKAYVTLKRSTRYRLLFQGVVSSTAQLVRAR